MPASTIYTAVEGDIAEKHMSLRENFDSQGLGQASVVLRVPWDLRHQVSADVLTARYLYPGGGFFGKASSVGIVPEADSAYVVTSGAIVYNFAEVTINYTTEQSDREENEDGDIFSESLEPHTEFMTLDPEKFRWEDAFGEKLTQNEAPGRQMRSFTLVRTLYNLTAVSTAILDLPGSANDDDYTSAILGLTFPQDTLLFGDPSIQRTFKSDGSRTMTLVLKFLYKKNGWNKFWRASSGTYEEIHQLHAGRYFNFPQADFSDFLF